MNQKKKITIVLVDDHSLVRDGIRALLEEEVDMEVIAEAADGAQALGVIKNSNPDLAIIDIRMPLLNGIEVVQKLREQQSTTKALILSMHDSEEYVLQAIEAGADGYLLKDASKDEFLKAIHSVCTGDKYFSGDISQVLIKKYLEKVSETPRPAKMASEASTSIPPEVKLTKRQKEILQLVVRGRSNKEIAEHLGKSIRTVEAHRFSLMKKLGVKNSFELTAIARDYGLL
ncbi:MAG: response regulator transcription factor [Saprospiraceae bacterium]|nr:response regulator transcription factor [Saprospiraceae bacterium]